MMAFINHIDMAIIRDALDPPNNAEERIALKLIDEAIAARADDDLIEQARARFSSGSGPFADEIEIDDVAGTSSTGDGTWVQAWVWVREDEPSEGDEA